ncbi:hypothetical protein [Paractinoplanes durhamensis]|uniref:hypothetical protein n=1 Tax=Paractinoplanes durhamensis TaxID=113563 RepID=UPI003635477A
MSRAVRLLAAVLIALGALVLPASPASAHAALIGSTPAPGSIIGASPPRSW